ncbi:hypothetical protein ABDK56_09395 [Sphingomonas sp. ASV193]
MSQAVPRPNSRALRNMAQTASDPLIKQALLDLAAEYDRTQPRMTRA